MARFDVYANGQESGYLLDVQADLLSALNTRVVVPLLPIELAPKAAHQLNPQFDIQGTLCSMVTQFMATVPAAELKVYVTSLAKQDSEIVAAIDFLHQGW